MKLIISELKSCHKSLVLELIADGHLRPEGILEENSRYWGAFINEALIGLIGCEYEKQYGLLRSAIVHMQYRGKGVGEKLTRRLLQAAKEQDLEAIYLFSTDAGSYWIKHGFKNVSVEEVVGKLPSAPQVKLFDELGWLPTEIAYKYDLKDF